MIISLENSLLQSSYQSDASAANLADSLESTVVAASPRETTPSQAEHGLNAEDEPRKAPQALPLTARASIEKVELRNKITFTENYDIYDNL